MAADDDNIAGWYGKIASLGDFASRRLPADFISLWDQWLQEVVAGSRAQLGDDAWLAAYLTSPVWHFLLFPGIYGEETWTGVLMPSVDRVGRYFPLAIALKLPALPSAPEDSRRLGEWQGELENIALATLDTNRSVQQFDDELAAKPFILPAPAMGSIPAAQCLLAALKAENSSPFAIPGGSALPTALSDLGHLLATEALHGKSLWWAPSVSAADVPTLACRGLPDAALFTAMLQPVAKSEEKA